MYVGILFSQNNEGLMKISWDEWNTAEKIIFVASIIAALSMLLRWTDVGIASNNGITSGGIILLAAFIYPMLKILKSEEINKKIALAGLIISILWTFYWIFVQNSIQLMGQSVNVSGSGLYIFLIASFALAFGVWKNSELQSSDRE